MWYKWEGYWRQTPVTSRKMEKREKGMLTVFKRELLDEYRYLTGPFEGNAASGLEA